MVALAVPIRRGATCSISERPVESACELGGIGHEHAPVAVTSVYEAALDRLDTTVHHVAGRHTVSASAGVVDSDFGDPVHRGVRVDRAIVVQQATVPVVSVFTEADVASNVEFWIERFKLLDR